MLVSTVRGFFRRIFNVDELERELIEERLFLSRPQRIVPVTITIDSGNTSGTAAHPSGFSGGAGGIVFAIPILKRSLGSATEFWISSDGSHNPVEITLDQDPEATVEFDVILVSI